MLDTDLMNKENIMEVKPGHVHDAMILLEQVRRCYYTPEPPLLSTGVEAMVDWMLDSQPMQLVVDGR